MNIVIVRVSTYFNPFLQFSTENNRKEWNNFNDFFFFFATISHPFYSLAARSRSTGFSISIRCVCVRGSIRFNCNLKYAAKAIVWNMFFLPQSHSLPFGFRLSHCSSAIVHMLIIKHFPSEKRSFFAAYSSFNVIRSRTGGISLCVRVKIILKRWSIISAIFSIRTR